MHTVQVVVPCTHLFALYGVCTRVLQCIFPPKTVYTFPYVYVYLTLQNAGYMICDIIMYGKLRMPSST